MLSSFASLFSWMPPVLSVVCIGVIAIFFIITIFRLIAFILDVIPFL